MQFDSAQLLALLEDHPATAGLFKPFPFSVGDLRRAGLSRELADATVSGEVTAALDGSPLGVGTDRLTIVEGDPIKESDSGKLEGRVFLVKPKGLQIVGRRTTLKKAVRRHACAGHLVQIKIEEAERPKSAHKGRDITLTVRAIRRGGRRRRRGDTGKHRRVA